MNEFYQWIDVLWMPVVMISAGKRHAFIALGFAASCMMMLRLQVELMDAIGFSHGFLNLIKMSGFERGLIAWSVFYFLYAVYGHYARNGLNAVFLAMSITIFFAALAISTFVMLV